MKTLALSIPLEPIKVAEAGVQTSSFNQTLTIFCHLCHSYGMQKSKLECKNLHSKIWPKSLKKQRLQSRKSDELEFNSFHSLPSQSLVVFPEQREKWKNLLPWWKLPEPIKVAEAGVQTSWNQTETIFCHLCYTFVMQKNKLECKIFIPKFDQNHQKSKGCSQGNFWEGLVMSLNLIPFMFFQVSPLLCFLNMAKWEHWIKLKYIWSSLLDIWSAEDQIEMQTLKFQNLMKIEQKS